MDTIYILALDSILALFLLGVMVLCVIVYRKLSIIKNGQAELAELVERLNAAVSTAQQSVAGIKVAAVEAEGDLGATIKKARAMVQELALMTEVGDNLANRLEASSTPKRRESPQTLVEEQTKEQKDIMAALKQAR